MTVAAISVLAVLTQGCVVMAVGGAAVAVTGAVAGAAGSVAVGTARFGGHVVASGARAASGTGNQDDRRKDTRRDSRPQQGERAPY